MAFLTGTAAIGRWQDSMTVLALLLAAHAAGFSLGQASITTAALALAAGLSATFKSRWMDRRGMRTTVGLLALATGIGYLLLVGALLLSLPALVIAAAVALGLFRTNSGACMQLTWMQVIKDDQLRARAVSWENLINTTMQNLGPLLVGALVALWSPLAALALCGAAVSLSMFSWSRSSVHAPANKVEQAEARRSWNIGWSIISVALAGLFINLLAGGMQVLLVGTVSPGQAALLNGALMVGAGAASIYALLRGFPFLNRLVTGIVLGIVTIACALPLVSSLSFVALLPVLAFAGILFGMSNTAITMLIQRRTSKERRAEAFSWRLTLAYVGMSLGQAITGQMLDAFGVTTTGLVLAVVGLLSALASFITLKGHPAPIKTARKTVAQV